MKKILGLDLGIASVGWSVVSADDNLNPTHIIDCGSYIFNKLEDEKGKLENQGRREKRSVRRQLRRKKLRLFDLKKLLKRELGVDFEKIIYHNYDSPFELKVKGLKEELTKEELAIALYHYMKYRGFKSNRKNEEKKTEGKMLDKMNAFNSSLNETGRTVTQKLWDDFIAKDKKERRIHNAVGEYLLTVERAKYLEEINLLFDKQIALGVCSSNLRDSFLNIYTRQRDFSEGPGHGSKYGAQDGESFLAKTIGVCSFDKEPRAPKAAYSAEAFVLLSYLNNFKYKEETPNGEENRYYSELTAEEIQIIFEKAKTKKQISVSDIGKWINKKITRVKGYNLSSKEEKKIREDFRLEKSEKLGIPLKDTRIDVDEYEELNKKVNEYLFSKKLNVGFLNYYTMKKKFTDLKKEKPELKEDVDFILGNDINFDVFAETLLIKKTDDSIKMRVKELGYKDFVGEILSDMESLSKTINLSLPICQQLIPYMKNKNTYDAAMSLAGYNHAEKKEVEKTTFIPEIGYALKELDIYLTNPVVKHTLVYMRRVVNELIRIYGTFSRINVECTRELKSSFEERQKIQRWQLDNAYENLKTKSSIIEKYSQKFRSINKISRDDLIRYKLFKEQGGIDPYSGERLREDDIFDADSCQIDHIIPYSRSFDDSFNNKVLTSSKNNQEKKNRTPYEWLSQKSNGIEPLKNFLNTHLVSKKKRDNLLVKDFDEHSDSDFDNSDISDTSYIAKLSKLLIASYLKVDVLFPSGGITDMLKDKWKLKGHTHSFQSEDLKNNYKFLYNGTKIEADNNLTTITISLVNNITGEEKLIVLKQKPKTDKKELSQRETEINNAIAFFRETDKLQSYIDATTNVTSGLGTKGDINLFIDKCSLYGSGENDQELKDNLFTIAKEIKSEIDKELTSKNRDNHLHHALDSIVIACTNRSIIQNVNTWSANNNGHLSFEAYKKQVPQPYDDFIDDAIYRVYERDYDTLKNKLLSLKCYQTPENIDDLNKYLKVLLPVRQPEKHIEGALFKDTIYGYKAVSTSEDGESITINEYITKRVPVENLSLDNSTGRLKKSIFGADINSSNYQANNKLIEDACIEWLKLSKDERKIIKYPTHPRTHNPIKKVRIIETENIKSKTKIKNDEKKYAANSDVVRVDVYTKKDDSSMSPKLYMVPIYYYQIATERLNEKYRLKNDLHKIKPINYQLMWAQGENGNTLISGEELKNSYNKKMVLPRYSLIELTILRSNEERTGLCYTGGCTSGKFEIYSILGDDLDIVSKDGNKLFNTKSYQYQITISTIKNIKVRSVSVLGKLS